MNKIYWHTGTLFKQWNKLMWARKYEHCIECWTCNYQHKAKWLCCHCREVERMKDKKRQIMRKIVKIRYWVRLRIKRKLATPKRKLSYMELKYWKADPERTKKIKRESKKNYYKNNKELCCLLWKVFRMRKSWKKCMEIIINNKTRYLPFASLDKPKTGTSKENEKYKKKLREFLILKKYYEKCWKRNRSL